MTGRGHLPVGIWVLGGVSLLMDLSSELIHGLLPAYLVTLGVGVSVVGLLDGVAEATALFVKVFSGALSDAVGRRKPLTVFGYGLSALSKPLFALAGGVPLIVVARVADRIGKGLRGAPRDALVAELAPPDRRGAAFGLRQSLDSVGAVLGPLAAVALMGLLADDVPRVFLVAVIPAALAVSLLVLGVREPAPVAAPPVDASPVVAGAFRWPLRVVELRRLPPAYWRVLGVTTLVMLARVSEGFLVLRAQERGVALGLVPLVLVVMNVAYALSAWPVGRLADRLPRPALLAVGLGVAAVAQGAIAVGGLPGLGLGIVLWGLHLGLSQGVLSAMVADAAPSTLRGTAFGLFHLTSGLALLLSSTVAGVIWDQAGPEATFSFGAATALAGLVALALWGRRPALPSAADDATPPP